MLAAVITRAEDIGKSENADLVELRLDFIRNFDYKKLKYMIKRSKKPVIVTCRKKGEGEFLKGSGEKSINILRNAIKHNADYVDIEYSSGKSMVKSIIKNKNKTKIIVSHHNFKGTPKNIENIYDNIKKMNPDLIKIVTTANSINDNFRVFGLLQGKDNLIAFCMGLKGEMSRILTPKFGSKITYASLGKGKVAPGQMAMEEMINLYHVHLINKKTNVIGIIGEFAENSMSKYMHNPNFVKTNANFVYVPFKVMKNELEEFMENFRRFNFKGAAVTIPHKEEIIKLIDELDETARQIGAVNTLVNSNGKIKGYNTDYYGAVKALEEQAQIKNKKVVVLGAGGAARAVVYGLKKEGAIITITNRTDERAKKLANEFKVDFGKFHDIPKLVKGNDIIINTTSIGMSPNENESILEEKDLAKNKIVMDIVYKPVNTKLIRLARRKGCKTITGNRMLVHQAISQFKLWTGINPSFSNMEKELESAINKIGK